MHSRELVRCALVCKLWASLYKADRLWFDLCISERIIYSQTNTTSSDLPLHWKELINKSKTTPLKESCYNLYTSYKLKRKKIQKRIHVTHLQTIQNLIITSPPHFFDYLTKSVFWDFAEIYLYQMVKWYAAMAVIISLILVLFVENSVFGLIKSFLRLSYPSPVEGLFYVGIADLAVIYSLFVIGPICCNLFEVGSKRFVSKYLAEECQTFNARNKLYREAWTLAVLILLNIWAVFTFSGVFRGFLPWVCSTRELWWEGWPVYAISDNKKWFFLIIIANDGYAVGSMLYKTFFTNSNVAIGLLHMVGSYFLVVTSYFGGYVNIASSILLVQNFSDFFLYLHKVIGVKEHKHLSLQIISNLSMLSFIVLFCLSKIVTASKIMYSILIEGPRYSLAINDWSGWLTTFILIGGMQAVYLYWVILIGKGFSYAAS